MSTDACDGTAIQLRIGKDSIISNEFPQHLGGISTPVYDGLKWIKQIATSPDLSLSELLDLDESEKELRQGKGKRFKDGKTLLEELETEDEE